MNLLYYLDALLNRVPSRLTTLGNLKVSVEETSATSGGGLTDAQLRATPVPVSGTVTTGGLTNAELRATVVPVEIETGATPLSESNSIPTHPATNVSVIATWTPVTAVGTTGIVTITSPVATALVLSIATTGLDLTGGTIGFSTVGVGGVGSSVIYGMRLDTLSMVSSFSPTTTGVSTMFLFDVAGTVIFTLTLTSALVSSGVSTVVLTARTSAGPAVSVTPTRAVVVNSAAPTLGEVALLTQTPEGRLRVDLEATSRDLGGVSVIDIADRQGRRLQEQLVLEAYEQSIRNLFLADSETSHRMGFEVR